MRMFSIFSLCIIFFDVLKSRVKKCGENYDSDYEMKRQGRCAWVSWWGGRCITETRQSGVRRVVAAALVKVTRVRPSDGGRPTTSLLHEIDRNGVCVAKCPPHMLVTYTHAHKYLIFIIFTHLIYVSKYFGLLIMVLLQVHLFFHAIPASWVDGYENDFSNFFVLSEHDGRRIHRMS